MKRIKLTHPRGFPQGEQAISNNGLTRSFKIRRWGVYLVNLNPQVGTKPGKFIPCVVVQDNILNEIEHPSTVILPITSKNITQDAYPLRVYLSNGEAGLNENSHVLVDQFLAWDNGRFVEHLGDLSSEKQEELEQACRQFFGWL